MRTKTFKQTYPALIRLFPYNSSKVWYVLLLAVLVVAPMMGPRFVTSYLTLIMISVIGAVGLNLVTGSTGLISLGHAGFLAVGAYTTAILCTDYGFDMFPALIVSGFLAALLSLLVGIPSLRLKGLYLAITTLAFSVIILNAIQEADFLTHGSSGISVKRTNLLGLPMSSPNAIYYLSLAITVLTVVGASNLLRSRIGRAWNAIRDYDTAAMLMGISLARYKLLAFAVSAFLTSIAGALMALHIRYVNVDNFGLIASIEAVAMIIVGGLGSVRGAVFGGLIITILPELSRAVFGATGGVFGNLSGAHTQEIKSIIYGLLIMIFLRFEPEGLAARWERTKRFWVEWPLSRRSA